MNRHLVRGLPWARMGAAHFSDAQTVSFYSEYYEEFLIWRVEAEGEEEGVGEGILSRSGRLRCSRRFLVHEIVPDDYLFVLNVMYDNMR